MMINIQNERVSFCGSNCGFVTIPRAETSVRPTGRPDDPTGRKSSQAPCSSLVCIERATNSLSLSRSLESFSEDLASTLRSIFMRAQVSSAWQWAAAERRAKKKKKRNHGVIPRLWGREGDRMGWTGGEGAECQRKFENDFESVCSRWDWAATRLWPADGVGAELRVDRVFLTETLQYVRITHEAARQHWEMSSSGGIQF